MQQVKEVWFIKQCPGMPVYKLMDGQIMLPFISNKQLSSWKKFLGFKQKSDGTVFHYSCADMESMEQSQEGKDRIRQVFRTAANEIHELKLKANKEERNNVSKKSDIVIVH